MDKLIKKVLVANRGEIAIRIFKTLHALGIGSVAIYSEADKHSSHVTAAQEAFLINGDSLKDTYLNIRQLIEAARHCHADAIHPGYGFLSESAAFSSAVREAGMVFIGPGDEAIRLMGNKVEARRFAEQMGVPVVRGATGQPAELITLAAQIGYPLLVKAAAGGGGKGMRIVHEAEELPEVLETTQREANSYFGNGEVYIERYLVRPQHIEVQLMADSHGNTVCLFERECSIQRRYQKIIEEAPSPSVSKELRSRLMDAARKIAGGIGYLNAGTIEFLVKDQEFFFLEMNTRIQVEHPVTEMITAIDLVREQIRVASGLPLSFSQEQLAINGHAIEARVYAEDPGNDFMPSPGTISFYKEPAGQSIRVDASLTGPGEVSRQFDPMISKVIAHGTTRNEAIRRLSQALKDYAVHGIKTNIHYMISLLETDQFIAGETDTGFCDHFSYKPAIRHADDQDLINLLTATCLFAGSKLKTDWPPDNNHNRYSQEQNYCKSPLWCESGYWRLSMTPAIVINGKEFKTEIISRTNNSIVFRNQQGSANIKLVEISADTLVLKENGKLLHVCYSRQREGSIFAQVEGRVFTVGMSLQLNEDEVNSKSHNTSIQENGSVFAPMHGKIIKVYVKEHDVVNKGDTLLVLESMKIENKILAPGKAVIERVAVAAGDVVSSNATLVLLAATV